MPLPSFLTLLSLVMIMAGLTVAAAFSANLFDLGMGTVIPAAGLFSALMGLALIVRFGTRGR